MVCSELVALLSAVKLDLTEPVVVGALGLVQPDSVKECSATEVDLNAVASHEVDRS